MGPSSWAALAVALLTACGSAGGDQLAEPAGFQGGTDPAPGTTARDVAAEPAPQGVASSAAPAAGDPPAADDGTAAPEARPAPPGSERHGPFAALPPTAVGLPQDFVAPPWPVDAEPLAKGMLAGSWAPGEEGFDQAWIDEVGQVQAFTNWRAGRRRWRGIATKGDALAVDVLIRDRTGPAVAYVFTLVQRSIGDPADPRIPDDAQAVLHIRHRGRLRAWFDGRLVADAPAPPPGEVGLIQVPVVLSSIYDVLLLKLGRGSPELGESMDVEARLSDLQGRPLEGQRWNSMRSAEMPSDLDELGIVQGRR